LLKRIVFTVVLIFTVCHVLEPHIFPVAVVENEQAVRCGLAGLYELSVNSEDISLHNISKRQLLYSWPYRFIRRYGKTSKNFQFESGRRCSSGEREKISLHVTIRAMIYLVKIYLTLLSYFALVAFILQLSGTEEK